MLRSLLLALATVVALGLLYFLVSLVILEYTGP